MISLVIKVFRNCSYTNHKRQQNCKGLSQLTSLNFFNLLIVQIIETLTKNIYINPVKIIFTTSKKWISLKRLVANGLLKHDVFGLSSSYTHIICKYTNLHLHADTVINNNINHYRFIRQIKIRFYIKLYVYII